MSEGLIAGTIVILLLLLFLVLFIAEYQKRRKQFLDEKMRLQQESLQSQLEIREQTLKNISEEIHDNIGQTLSLVKINLNRLIKKPVANEEQLLQTRDLVSKAIQDLRAVSRSMNSGAVLRDGLLHAIEWELMQVERTGYYRTELMLTGEPEALDPRKELILFRIFQEALNNVIKHAQAKTIEVRLAYNNGLILQIRDNGQGFDLKDGSTGIGLHNIRNRAALIGAQLNMESSAAGTILELTLPTETS